MKKTTAYDLRPSYTFLEKLKDNNHKEWFSEHKEEYRSALEQVTLFAQALLEDMRMHDHIETGSGKKSLHRIYRDIRFSKDKTPYKSNWAGSFKRATSLLRGGYYYHLQKGNTFIAGGFFGPSAKDLRHLRDHIDQDDTLIRQVLESSEFKNYFGQLEGEAVKTAPKGFSREHPTIDLLRRKQYILRHSFTDKEANSRDFHQKMAQGFSKMRPFFDVMSELLTTDLNGVPLNV